MGDKKIYYTNSVTHHKQLLAIILKTNGTRQTDKDQGRTEESYSENKTRQKIKQDETSWDMTEQTNETSWDKTKQNRAKKQDKTMDSICSAVAEFQEMQDRIQLEPNPTYLLFLQCNFRSFL